VHYHALVHKEAGSAYGVTFPDIPGCFSAADTAGEIEAKAIEALDLWFEDGGKVEPRAIEEIREDADVSQALASGAWLMVIPFIADDSRIERVNITLTRGVRRLLDEEAKRRGTSRSRLIAESVTRHLLQGHSGASETS